MDFVFLWMFQLVMLPPFLKGEVVFCDYWILNLVVCLTIVTFTFDMCGTPRVIDYVNNDLFCRSNHGENLLKLTSLLVTSISNLDFMFNFVWSFMSYYIYWTSNQLKLWDITMKIFCWKTVDQMCMSSMKKCCPIVLNFSFWQFCGYHIEITIFWYSIRVMKINGYSFDYMFPHFMLFFQTNTLVPLYVTDSGNLACFILSKVTMASLSINIWVWWL